MGFYAYLEIENYQSISVKDEFGVNVGNPLASFLFVYEHYIANRKKSENFDWFSFLEGKTTQNIQILPRICYAYSGELTDEEINEYVSGWQESDPITKEELISRTKIENKWENIVDVMNAVNEIVRILPVMGEDTYWYVKENTYPAFISLKATLQQALVEGGKRVRLHFE
jgi:hypothetical protein